MSRIKKNVIMEKTRKTNRYRHVTHSITFSLLLIVAGLAFLGFNLGYISTSYKDIIFSWPMLIIVWGIFAFCNSNFRQGVLLLIVGGFFIVPRIANVCPGLCLLTVVILFIFTGQCYLLLLVCFSLFIG